MSGDTRLVQAELVAADPEACKLAARARNRNAMFRIWLREAEGTFAYKYLRTQLLLQEITDPKEHAKLVELWSKIKGVLHACTAREKGDGSHG